MKHVSLQEFLADILAASDKSEHQWATEVLGSQKFNFGEYENLPHLAKVEHVFPYVEHCPQIFNLPYANCLFYTEGGIFLHVKNGMEPGLVEVRMTIYTEDAERRYIFPIFGIIDYAGGRLKFEPFLDSPPQEESKALELLAFLYTLCATFLSVLNASNVTTIENIPSVESDISRLNGTNKRMLVYKTLHIKPGIDAKSGHVKTTAGGLGTRVHLRRGHIRRLKNKVTWVQSAVVGTAKYGTVLKQYVVAPKDA